VETVNRLAPTQIEVKPGSIVLGLVMDTLTGRSPPISGKRLGNSPEPSQRPIGPAALCRVAETTVTLYDKPYRAVVVHESAHDKRRQKKIERELARDSASLKKNFQEQCLSEYACEADAKAAAHGRASQPSRYHDLSYAIEPLYTYARGRPKKHQPRQVTKVCYWVSCQLQQKASALEQMRMEAGCFVLLTNVGKEGEGATDAREILSLYKSSMGWNRALLSSRTLPWSMRSPSKPKNASRLWALSCSSRFSSGDSSNDRSENMSKRLAVP
jgi:hypothetical protein